MDFVRFYFEYPTSKAADKSCNVNQSLNSHIWQSMYGRDKGYEYIHIKSPEIDIFFILLHYALIRL